MPNLAKNHTHVRFTQGNRLIKPNWVTTASIIFDYWSGEITQLTELPAILALCIP